MLQDNEVTLNLSAAGLNWLAQHARAKKHKADRVSTVLLLLIT
jgi:hypothetical protein